MPLFKSLRHRTTLPLFQLNFSRHCISGTAPLNFSTTAPYFRGKNSRHQNKCAIDLYFSKILTHNSFTKCIPVSCLLSHVSVLTSPVLCLMSPVSHLLSYVPCLMSPISCLKSPVSRLLSHISYLKYCVSNLLLHVS